MTLIRSGGKRVILDVTALPTTGESKYIYHNTTDGYFYYWNDVTDSYVKLEQLDVLTTVQPTPTATGNTTNLNKVFKDANGDTWIVDFNGDAIKAGQGSKSTTSLTVQYGNGTTHVNARADSMDTVADVVKLSDGSLINNEDVVLWENHGLNIHSWYFTSPTIAGGYTDVPPSAPNYIQRLFYVVDANHIKIQVQEAEIATNEDTTPPVVYENIVYFNNTNPTSATIFDTANPPVINNNSLKQDDQNIYVGTDGSVWVWNGTAYITKTFPNNTEWYIYGTTTDAGNNKTGQISRLADIYVNDVRVGRGNGNVASNVVVGSGGAMAQMTTGTNNGAFGYFALAACTTGSDNFAMGFASQGANVTGSGNVSMGRASLRFATGNNNTAFGYTAGLGLTTGNFNSFFGQGSGANLTSGTSNTSVGSNTNFQNATASNQLSIANFINGQGMGTANGGVGFGFPFVTPNATIDSTGSFGANISIKTANYTTVWADHTIVMGTAGTTLTLESPVNRKIINVKNNSGGNITVSGHIDNVAATSVTIPAGGAATFHSTSTTWFKIQ